MQAYGSDRVRVKGEQIMLASRFDKGWTARVPKTLTTAEFPGTAVLWEERYYEVAAMERLPQGAMRYVLEPWREHLAMRQTDRYDADAETVRFSEFQKKLQREKHRKSANLAGLLTGHLPAIVQNELGSEIGVLPPRLTLISILGEYLVVVGFVLLIVHRVTTHGAIPLWLVLSPAYLAIEGAIRFLVNWTQSRAIGSSIGFFAYLIYHLVSGRGPSPFAEEKGMAIPISEPPADIAARDAILMKEPFLTLLTPADQQRIAARYDYDYKRESKSVAIALLIVSAIGVVSAFMAGGFISMFAAAALGAEQVMRLAAFRSGPAGSVLRFAVRPFVRKLIA